LVYKDYVIAAQCIGMPPEWMAEARHLHDRSKMLSTHGIGGLRNAGRAIKIIKQMIDLQEALQAKGVKNGT
jgi:hypothetical protein